MEELIEAHVLFGAGLEGDYTGAKYPDRGITVLAREAWEEALGELTGASPAPMLPWIARRANLLVEGVSLPAARGGVLQIGPVRLEVTRETSPCRRMDEARPGLLKALHPGWRGGVTCRVVADGIVSIGDAVEVLVSPQPQKIVLPG